MYGKGDRQRQPKGRSQKTNNRTRDEQKTERKEKCYSNTWHLCELGQGLHLTEKKTIVNTEYSIS